MMSSFDKARELLRRFKGGAYANGTGVEVLGTIRGAAPNAPLEDLARISADLVRLAPDVIVSFGGGSTIDCTKAAEVLRTLGGSVGAPKPS
jgi:alcohol dehydrogenase class IV